MAEAIESVLAQSHAPIECLVIDDGSTDGTRDAVATFGHAVNYVRQAHSGVSMARNRGTELAHGDLVAFLDHDDTWLPDKLALQIAAMQAGRSTMVLCALEVIDAAGAPLGTKRLGDHSDLVTGMVMFDGTDTVSCSSTSLIGRQELTAMGGFDPSLAMSADWEPLVRYRVHDSNMSRSVGAMERDMNHAFAKAFAHPKLPAALRHNRGLAYSRLYRMLSGSYRDSGERVQALRTLAIALRYNPRLAFELIDRFPGWRTR